MTPATRMGLSIAAAVSLYGLSFGALSVASGLTLWQTVALSALLFSGGSQFAFIGILAAGGSGGAALGASTLLSARNTIYAVQMKAMFDPSGWRRWVSAQLTIDESAANAMSQTDPEERRRGFWVTGLGVYVGWNLATVVGALLGDFVAEPEALGLDGAVVAAFLGLLWPRLRSREPWALAVVAALVTVLTMPMLPAGVPVLLAAVVAAAWGLVTRGRSGGAESTRTRKEHEEVRP
ncbi:AzlC family ABC transporter permease [Nesterenkonia sp. CL21]|uniref:AzlC family ABC transporter permease n=1 Tax=Nesterenkonia sp. CL21 TaxID=3064894 RepID=UPI00287B46A2|nr:AzlC family ABC transporter permease [Nesterenkonia sp. CL21]MDS2172343.1 AzlC family ABC transporter permease [Nesterenkonia sp. CL21]